MNHYKYVIVGGGMTADAAARGIRELDKAGTIAIIGDEVNPPYNRPPLSKGLWKGKSLDYIWRRTTEQSVDLILGRVVTSFDPANKTVQINTGEVYFYDKLLLATGGTPRHLPFGGENILYFRTLEDYQKLRGQVGKHKHFAVIGGGFIGSEVAAALAMNGEKVTMVFPEDAIGARVYPQEVSLYLNQYYTDKGVQVFPGVNVKNINTFGDVIKLEFDSGNSLDTDFIIAGIGLIPNIQMAQSNGVKVNKGILVDEFLGTNLPDIYSAGDVAEFYQPLLQKWLRLEHEDNANQMGIQAGLNMAGAHEPYQYLPYFYSDLFDIGYEAVGELDSRFETFIDWQEPFNKGVIYYLRDRRVRGVLLWNVWDALDSARELIAAPGPFTSVDLSNRIAQSK